MVAICVAEEPAQLPLLEFAISLPIIIVLQIALLCQSSYNEYKKNNKTSLVLRILYILLQITGIFWTVNDLFRFVTDPLTSSTKHTASCVFMAYAPKIVPWIFYTFYFAQIFLRTERSFRGSHLAIGRAATYVLSSLILSQIVLLMPVFIIVSRHISACKVMWDPSEGLVGQLSFCDFPISASDTYPMVMFFVEIVLIFILNIIFCVIFKSKLNKLLSANKDNIHIAFRFQALIVKNTILTIFGTVSTMLAYLFWYFGFSVFTLHIDLLLNCMVIGLMFRYNNRYYTKLCRCCVLVCFRSQKTDEEQQRIRWYLDHDGEIESTKSRNLELRKVTSVSSMPSSSNNIGTSPTPTASPRVTEP